MRDTILFIEDDRDIQQLVRDNILSLGYEVEFASDGERGCELALKNSYALIILDINLPRLDGIEVCQRIRTVKQQVPILMLSARDREIDRVRGLELGADDYLTKPFGIEELRARIKALMRRLGRQSLSESLPSAARDDVLHFAELIIDCKRRKVTLSGNVLDLSAKEYELLLFFASRPGVPLKRSELLAGVWSTSVDSYESNVNTHVNRLRLKLESSGKGRFIKTVRGVGYRFAELNELEVD